MNINQGLPTKMNLHFTLSVAALLAIHANAADPRTNSWLTTYTSKYARIYTNNAMKASGTALTTWSNGSQTPACRRSILPPTGFIS